MTRDFGPTREELVAWLRDLEARVAELEARLGGRGLP